MKTIAVTVAILSACFMQDVSGSFLKKTEEKKDGPVIDPTTGQLGWAVPVGTGHRHNADKMVEEKTDIEADQKHMDNEETDIEDVKSHAKQQAAAEKEDAKQQAAAEKEDAKEQAAAESQQAAAEKEERKAGIAEHDAAGKAEAGKEEETDEAERKAGIAEHDAAGKAEAGKEEETDEAVEKAGANEQAAKRAAEKADAKEQAPEVDDPYTEGDKLGMKKALKKLDARVKVLTKRAEKAGASDADKLIAKSGKKALKAASKQDQAIA